MRDVGDERRLGICVRSEAVVAASGSYSGWRQRAACGTVACPTVQRIGARSAALRMLHCADSRRCRERLPMCDCTKRRVKEDVVLWSAGQSTAS